MRWFICLVFVISIFTSCDHPKKPYLEELIWPKRTIMLDNDLGVLTIRLPGSFDTIFKWRHVSDCGCCGAKRYRFQNAKFPVVQDKDYITTEVADSIFSLTISHSPDKKCNANIKWEEFDLTSFLNNQKNKIYGDQRDTTFEISKIESINGKNAAILAYKNEPFKTEKGNNLQFQTFNSWILTTDELIELEFNCVTSNCDSFIPKMYKALKTVEIKPN